MDAFIARTALLKFPLNLSNQFNREANSSPPLVKSLTKLSTIPNISFPCSLIIEALTMGSPNTALKSLILNAHALKCSISVTCCSSAEMSLCFFNGLIFFILDLREPEVIDSLTGISCKNSPNPIDSSLAIPSRFIGL